MRFFNESTLGVSMEDRASGDDAPQDERLRRLVDCLPPRERHMTERVFFGQATLTEAASEIGLSRSTGARLLANGQERLRLWLTSGHTPEEPEAEESYEVPLDPEPERPPLEEIFSQAELDTLLWGRWKGDGRRIDTYVTGDPVPWRPDDDEYLA